MKKSYIGIVFCVCWVFSVISCQKGDFLDQTQSTTLNEATVFADSAYSMNFLNGIYSNVGFSSSPFRFTCGLESACDESEGYVTGQGYTFVQFASGTVNSSIVSKDAWTNCYSAIRAVNMFLKHLPAIKFSSDLKTRTKAEARFLRAWYYFILLEHYGGIPLVGDNIYTTNSSISLNRDNFDKCVDYIVHECDTAANDLPWQQSGVEYGRASKGACIGLKTRTLLYAASPLFNGGGIATSEPLRSITGYTSYDKERWRLAMEAADEIIQSGEFELFTDNTTAPGYGFYNVFTIRKTDEMIFAKMEADNKTLEMNWLPPSVYGTPTTFPYLELVNAFGMKNGLPISDPGSGYDESNPYLNRDPRFDYSIVHNNSMIIRYPESVPLSINTCYGSGVDAIYTGTQTGYYPFKMVDETLINGLFTSLSHRCMPLIRYAEILLDYAEARNEYLSSPDQAVYDAIEAVRQRAGLDPYQLPVGLTQDEMREKIQAERRVELAFEGHRFFDVRRWKIAEVTENATMHGTEPVQSETGIDYKTITIRKHNFVNKMYLWPIPESEIAKDPKLIQNPEY